MYPIKTKSGKILPYDSEKWIRSTNRICKVIEEHDEFYILENELKEQCKISKSVIFSNQLEIIDNTIELGEGLYWHHFLEGKNEAEYSGMNSIFNENVEKIFSNRAIVLGKAEYYLLEPSLLVSGTYNSGGYSCSLGAIIEYMQSDDNPFYFVELSGRNKMHLISLGGSPFSGSYHCTFWSDEENKMIKLGPKELGNFRNKSLLTNLSEFQKLIHRPTKYVLDYKIKAVNQLISEIDGAMA